MRKNAMKHSASIWDGEVGASRCIDVVHWEGDITPEELANVASQISPDWDMVDLQLDPVHPLHGNTYQLRRLTDDEYEEAELIKRRAAFATKHAGKRVWVHGYHIEVRPGEHTDQPFFYDTMFSTVLTTLDDIEALCDQHYGAGIWDEYSLYLDNKLPKPLAINF